MKNNLLGCLFSLMYVSSFAQLDWRRVDSAFGKLPSSVQVYKTTDSLNGHPFIAYLVVASLKDRKLEFTTQVSEGKRLTPTQFYEQEGKPLLVMNGTFFSFATNQNLNLVMRNDSMVAYNQPSLQQKGTDSFYYPTRSAIGLTKSRRADVAWIFTDTAQRWPYAFQESPILAKGTNPDPSFADLKTLEQWKWWKMRTAIGGGPVLVKDGLINVTNEEEQMFVKGENDRHPRTAMGYTRKRQLLILVIQGRFPGIADGATLTEEAKILTDLGCVEALNLDGGGSSCVLVNGKETIQVSDKTGQRPVPGVFIIREKKRK
ncbi:MAG: phosphodiester glycosidase family protein [Niastella sp.]|nr:phosphodiester glycosidase family protein [Niastella sp.]